MHPPILNIDKLIPSGSTEISHSMIQEQKKWIQFVNHWTLWLKYGILSSHWGIVDKFVEDTLGMTFDDPLDFDFYKNPIKLAQEIKRELYLGKDIQSTQNKIVELMSDTINKKSLKNFIQQ
jgi:hypothetical protein